MKLSKEVFLLYKELERLEEVLDFSVFYTLEEDFDSHHFLPGFEDKNYYYEIQANSSDELKVIRFNSFQEEGYIMTDEEILLLIKEFKKL